MTTSQPDAKAPHPEPLPVVVDQDIHDAHELANTIRGWELECRNTGPPTRTSRLIQLADADVLLTRVVIGAPMLQEGAAPPELHTFALLDPGVRIDWCGQQTNSESLFSFHIGSSFDCVSSSDFRVVGVSVGEDTLNEAAASLGLPDADTLAGQRPHNLHCETQPLGDLQETVRRLAGTLEEKTGPEEARAARRVLREEVPAQIVSALAAGRVPDQRSTGQERMRAVERALDYIRSRPKDPMGIAELCRVVECNERTLRRAFLDRFGLATRDYLRAVRLNGAFRTLCAADPATDTVTQVAREWGFWHLGEFAGHYRNLFDERPSQTLQRTAAKRAQSALTTGR